MPTQQTLRKAKEFYQQRTYVPTTFTITEILAEFADQISAEKDAEIGRTYSELALSQRHLSYFWHQTRSCPCGARLEDLNAYPHVPGCPTESAIMKAE